MHPKYFPLGNLITVPGQPYVIMRCSLLEYQPGFCLSESVLRTWKKISLNSPGFASETRLAGLAEGGGEQQGSGCLAETSACNITGNIHMISVQRLIGSRFLSPRTLLRARSVRIKKCVLAPGTLGVRWYRSTGGGISLYAPKATGEFLDYGSKLGV